jgi:hypothetical protein
LGEALKSVEEMKIKSDFDHQMIDDKDMEIERLINEKKALRMQLDTAEKERAERVEKNEKDLKGRKEVERIKRDN